MIKKPVSGYQETGANSNALFTLKVHRGEGMALLAMNWKTGKPSDDFVGFSIAYKEPGGDKLYPLRNRLSFPGADQNDPNVKYTTRSPIQKFRWVHFPRNAELEGLFTYQVTPVFMNGNGEINTGEAQEVQIALSRETYPNALNVCFTRGFVSSQAFVNNYEKDGAISTLIASPAKTGLDFTPTHPDANKALAWMGFEAYSAIIEVLDLAIANPKAKVCIVAYDFNEPEILGRLKKLKKRLRIILDESGEHGNDDSAETKAAEILAGTTGEENVLRQKMGSLQHNKTIVVDGPGLKKVICGSTNMSWRGLFIQNNNAVVLTGAKPVSIFQKAFENFWKAGDPGKVGKFNGLDSATWQSLGVDGLDAKVTFSPHSADNSVLQYIADDIGKVKGSLLYSMAFLAKTGGPVRNALTKITESTTKFVYGIADSPVGGIVLKAKDGNPRPVSFAAINKNIPEPFKAEPTGGGGIRMHHKFLVMDFDKEDAKVYMGSYNFSEAADSKNGENLLVIKDRRIATAYMIEAVRIFDHYEFRLAESNADKKNKKLVLQKPPTKMNQKPWWNKYWTNKRYQKDRELFS